MFRSLNCHNYMIGISSFVFWLLTLLTHNTFSALQKCSTFNCLSDFSSHSLRQFLDSTRGKPLVQFADIRKVVLRQDLPHCLQLWVNPCVILHAQGLNSSLHAWPPNLEAFSNTMYVEDRRKRTKCDQFFHTRSDFFNFSNPYFSHHTLTDGVGLVGRVFAEICDQFITCQSC